MSYRLLGKRIAAFMEKVTHSDLWKKSTKFVNAPVIADVRVRETRDGYDITVSMRVQL